MSKYVVGLRDFHGLYLVILRRKEGRGVRKINKRSIFRDRFDLKLLPLNLGYHIFALPICSSINLLLCFH
jgi:hypothetical protein